MRTPSTALSRASHFPLLNTTNYYVTQATSLSSRTAWTEPIAAPSIDYTHFALDRFRYHPIEARSQFSTRLRRIHHRLTSAKRDLVVTLHLTLRHAWICPITCSPDKSPFHQNLDCNLALLDVQITSLLEQHRQVVQESLAYLGNTETWLPSA